MDFAPIMGPAKYGLDPSDTPAASNAQTSLSSVPSPGVGGAAAAKLASLENPFTVWAIAAAAVFGLMAFSTSVRVGHTTGTVSLGNT